MNPEQQRIAIAETCGWKCIDESEEFGKLWWEHPELSPIGTPHIPDYLNDLNAMHVAEKTLTRQQWSEYTALLNSSLHAGNQGICQAICHAAAWQRAEAFLRTKGLWKESFSTDDIPVNHPAYRKKK